MNKILVTGAGGFVGTYLIKELQKNTENEIFAAVFKSTSDVSSLLPPDHILEGDLTNYQVAESHLKTSTPSLIYHLAAISIVHSSVVNALSVMQSNTAISYNILEAMHTHAPSARFIAICSANQYGAVDEKDIPIKESVALRPLNPYAVSKVTQEMLALQAHYAYGLDVVVLRPFNHTGVGQTTDFVIPRLAETFANIEKGNTPPIVQAGNLDSIRDFTDVRDIVRAYVLAAEMGLPGEIYNIGSGEGHTIRQVVEIFESISKSKVTIKESEEISRRADVPVLVADTTKFRDLTGFFPTISLQRTISDILEYYRNK
jgi:GDP-4-dehydro-6-deoxy-D-mannose reductase